MRRRSRSKVPPARWASKWWRADVMAKLSKKAKKLAEAVDIVKLHGVSEAISLVKSNATAKFDETIEVAINLGVDPRSEEHTSELQSLMRNSYAVFCSKKK